ncbi:hypothetical protein PCNPT3_04975 [Psychromonas sp. CNPT3]|nr:hypothetical protein PCNPT3_04975 [Psychromonas sp. CNPT3]
MKESETFKINITTKERKQNKENIKHKYIKKTFSVTCRLYKFEENDQHKYHPYMIYTLFELINCSSDKLSR